MTEFTNYFQLAHLSTICYTFNQSDAPWAFHNNTNYYFVSSSTPDAYKTPISSASDELKTIFTSAIKSYILNELVRNNRVYPFADHAISIRSNQIIIMDVLLHQQDLYLIINTKDLNLMSLKLFTNNFSNVNYNLFIVPFGITCSLPSKLIYSNHLNQNFVNYLTDLNIKFSGPHVKVIVDKLEIFWPLDLLYIQLFPSENQFPSIINSYVDFNFNANTPTPKLYSPEKSSIGTIGKNDFLGDFLELNDLSNDINNDLLDSISTNDIHENLNGIENDTALNENDTMHHRNDALNSVPSENEKNTIMSAENMNSNLNTNLNSNSNSNSTANTVEYQYAENVSIPQIDILYQDPGAPRPLQNSYSPLNFNPIIKTNLDNKYITGGKYFIESDSTNDTTLANNNDDHDKKMEDSFMDKSILNDVQEYQTTTNMIPTPITTINTSTMNVNTSNPNVNLHPILNVSPNVNTNYTTTINPLVEKKLEMNTYNGYDEDSDEELESDSEEDTTSETDEDNESNVQTTDLDMGLNDDSIIDDMNHENSIIFEKFKFLQTLNLNSTIFKKDVKRIHINDLKFLSMSYFNDYITHINDNEDESRIKIDNECDENNENEQFNEINKFGEELTNFFPGIKHLTLFDIIYPSNHNSEWLFTATDKNSVKFQREQMDSLDDIIQTKPQLQVKINKNSTILKINMISIFFWKYLNFEPLKPKKFDLLLLSCFNASELVDFIIDSFEDFNLGSIKKLLKGNLILNDYNEKLLLIGEKLVKLNYNANLLILIIDADSNYINFCKNVAKFHLKFPSLKIKFKLIHKEFFFDKQNKLKVLPNFKLTFFLIGLYNLVSSELISELIQPNAKINFQVPTVAKTKLVHISFKRTGNWFVVSLIDDKLYKRYKLWYVPQQVNTLDKIFMEIKVLLQQFWSPSSVLVTSNWDTHDYSSFTEILNNWKIIIINLSKIIAPLEIPASDSISLGDFRYMIEDRFAYLLNKTILRLEVVYLSEEMNLMETIIDDYHKLINLNFMNGEIIWIPYHVYNVDTIMRHLSDIEVTDE